LPSHDNSGLKNQTAFYILTAEKEKMKIQVARVEDLPIIQKIAFDTWPATYGHLMSREQFTFMLDWMYSLESLQQQFTDGQVFLLATENNRHYGFASYELNYKGTAKTKVHKLYILPESQGKGVGKLLIEKITEAASANQNRALTLNVKRDNQAIDFYNRVGFQIIANEDIDIGNGFMMKDYIMELEIGN
jgi:diamine N-acetyltransferase